MNGTTQKALSGATVELTASVSGGNNGALTYTWQKGNSPISGCTSVTSSTCKTFVRDPGVDNLTLVVSQANQQSVTKTINLNGVLPILGENPGGTYPILNGYSGIERVPRVTTGGGDCARPDQRLMLGCSTGNPDASPEPIPPAPNDKDISGLYVRAAVKPPSSFISKGNESVVEFYQVGRNTNLKRFGKSDDGRSFSQIGKQQINPDGWRFDVRGSAIHTQGYTTSATFNNLNNNSNNNSIILDFTDSPSNRLTKESPGFKFNEYHLSEQFKTYIFYTNSLPIGVNRADANHALYVIRWSWSAKANRSFNSDWRLFGNPDPQTPTQLFGQGVPYEDQNVNLGGLEPTQGNFKDDIIWGEKIFDKLSTIRVTTKRDVAVWRKTNGVWYVMDANGGLQQATQWGSDYDITVPADYDGDGRADFAVYRPDNPTTPQNECNGGCFWYILKSSDGSLFSTQFGISGDKPVPADFDGDGRADISVYRPGDTVWYITKSSDGSLTGAQFGSSTDTPVPSDYDGDGIDDLAVWTASTATWSVRKSSNLAVVSQVWGYSSDQPVIGDYDGDGKTDFANWQTDGIWHILLSGSGQAKFVSFGNPATDMAIPGDYDGDDITDIAVWRPSATQSAQWYILNSGNNQIQTYQFGSQGDVPVPAAYTR